MSEPATIIVLDAGPAISMDRLQYADSLQSQPDLELVLPETVAAELVRKSALPGAVLPERLRQEAVDEDVLMRLRESRGNGPMLGAGELGVIAVSERLSAAGTPNVISILDDRHAWKFALERWTSDKALTGTLGLLYLVHERGLAHRGVGGRPGATP